MSRAGGSADKDSRQAQGGRIIFIGALVNLMLIGLKALVGLMAASQALIADAVHSASDLITDVIAFIGIRLASTPADGDHHFGHARMETLASAGVGLALILTAIFLARESYLVITGPVRPAPGWSAALAAGLALLAKEALYRATMRVAEKLDSPALAANAWHHRSDALSSLAVLAGAGAAAMWPRFWMLDAWAALLVAALIFKAGAGIILGAVREFTDAAPPQKVQAAMLECASTVSGVLGVHDLKARSMGGRFHVELHVEVDASLTVLQGHEIACKVEQCLLRDVPGVSGAIVHMDPVVPGSVVSD